jgi:hypothetical protein
VSGPRSSWSSRLLQASLMVLAACLALDLAWTIVLRVWPLVVLVLGPVVALRVWFAWWRSRW